jgi:mono/diheme cytochrome c family protein
VSFRLSIRQFVRPAWLLPLTLLGLVCLPGCEDQYNENMVFPVRTDPVILKINEVGLLIGEVPEPDPPGQLPLMTMKGLQDPRNLFHLQLDEAAHGTTEAREQAEKELKEKREKLKGYLFDPADLSAERRSELQSVLQEIFGTPAHPQVNLKAISGTTKQAAVLEKRLGQQVKRLRLDEETLKEGGRLYRLHCMQCHGLTGDGRGPTSRWVNPHPRDYRAGVFKFQSVNQSDGKTRAPRRADLFRTIKFGVEGTTMPAHNLLPDHEIDTMVSYVIFLSVRGQTELETLQGLSDAKAEVNIRASVFGAKPGKGGKVAKILDYWNESQLATLPTAQSFSLAIKPGPYVTNTPEQVSASVLRGKDLFAVNCGKCHNDYGRQALYKMDTVGWGILVRPANLTTGVYRGGRRPIDLYWRIHSGINGAAMPPLGKFTDEDGNTTGVLDPDQIWDVVNFLQALPYPAMQRQYGIRIN